MSMNGIDISSWDDGINLYAVPADFVIVKATQGTSYISPSFERQAQDTLACGKRLGIYHYVGGGGAEAEAEFFITVVQHYLGLAALCIDWESNQNPHWGDESYLEALCSHIISHIGLRPLIYASASVFPWDVAKRLDCGCWVAQYADNNETGYQSTPWNEGAYSCAIRQYSSCGKLEGYSGRLDLNKAYMDADGWDAYCMGGKHSSNDHSTHSEPLGDALELAAAVMRGEYGNGNERKVALGDRYEEVQQIINWVASAPASDLAREVMAGTYDNGDTRKAVLGSRYDEVQQIVNREASVDIDALAQAVINGDYGNGQERKDRLGDLYERVQARVNEMLG